MCLKSPRPLRSTFQYSLAGNANTSQRATRSHTLRCTSCLNQQAHTADHVARHHDDGHALDGPRSRHHRRLCCCGPSLWAPSPSGCGPAAGRRRRRPRAVPDWPPMSRVRRPASMAALTRVLDGLGLVGQVQGVAEHRGDGEDGADGVDDALSRDIGCRTWGFSVSIY